MSGSGSLQNLPQLAIPLVNKDGTVSFAWYRFFIGLFQRVFTAGVNANGVPIATDQTLAQETADREAADATLQTQINVLDTKVAPIPGLQTNVTTLNGEVATLNSEVTTLQGRVDGLIVGATAGSATAGGGGALPATVQAYLQITVGSTNYKVPLYLP